MCDFGTVASESGGGLYRFGLFGLLVEVELFHFLLEFEFFVLDLFDFTDFFELLFLNEGKSTIRLVCSSSRLFSYCLSLIYAPRSLFMGWVGVKSKLKEKKML